jgi:DNA-binding transcriptional ArsR family regulator
LTVLVNRGGLVDGCCDDGRVSVSIDVSGVADDQYVFAPSPLADLGSALHLLVEPGHHAQQGGWIAAAEAQLDPDLMDRIVTADYLWRTSRSDMLLPSHPKATLAEELDVIDQLDDETWVRTALMTSSCGVVPLRDDLRSPLVDDTARTVARERAASRGARQLDFVDYILADPTAARSWLRRLLEDCATGFFAAAWRRVGGRLAADVRHKRDLLARHGLERTLAAVSSAVTLSASGERIVVDKLQDRAASSVGVGLTFTPSAFSHPHLLVVYAPGWRPVIHYPLLDTPSEPSVSVAAVQDRLHALDHPVRLRLLRSIARGPQTTAQLAETWLLTPPEVSRHLAILKNAAVITAARRGRYVNYELDLTANARLGTDLIEALLR